MPKEPPTPVDPVQQLFEQLKAVRKAVAAKAQVPAYVVFSDASLLDMAQKRPSSMEEFMKVSGVGERKGVRYGKRFISAIRKFEGMSASMPQGTSVKETLILHNAGVGLGEIAEIKGISVETVRSHIAQLIDEDMVTTFGNYISRTEYEDIARTLASDPEGKTLREKYSFGMISLAKAIMAYHQRAK